MRHRPDGWSIAVPAPPRELDVCRTVCVAVGTAVALVAAALALRWGCAGAIAAVRADGPAGYDAVLTLVLAALGWGALSWLAAGVMLTALGALPGTLGRCSQLLLLYVVPRTALHLAALLLGVGVATGLLAGAAPAWADPPPSAARTDTASAAMITVGSSGLGAVRSEADLATGTPAPRVPELPVLDRPVAAPPPAAIAPAPTAGTERPVTPAAQSPQTEPWVPSAPVRPLPTADAAAARIVAPPPHSDESPAEVVVRRGDRLWEIAARHLPRGSSAADVAREWPRWYAANRAVIGADPDYLLPGQVLQRPG